MRPIQFQGVEQAVQFLTGAGCKFTVVTPNGHQFSNMDEKSKQAKRNCTAFGREYGEMAKYIESQFDLATPIGATSVISIGKYDPEHVRRSLCAKLSKTWGKGTYQTIIEGNEILVLRTA